MTELHDPERAPGPALVGSLSSFSLLEVLDLLGRTNQHGSVICEHGDRRLVLWVDGDTLVEPGPDEGGRTLFEAACATEGWFSFADVAGAPDGGTRQPVEAVVNELGPKVAEWRELVGVLPFTSTLRLADAATSDEVQIRAGEWQLLSRIGNLPGQRVRQVVDGGPGEPLDSLRTLRGLVQAGLVVLEEGAPESTTPSPAPTFDPPVAANGNGNGATPVVGEQAAAPAVTPRLIPRHDQGAPDGPGAPVARPEKPGWTPSTAAPTGAPATPFFPSTVPDGDPGDWGTAPAAAAAATGEPRPEPATVMPPPITGDPWSSTLAER